MNSVDKSVKDALGSMGRASTPAVANNPFNLNYLDLISGELVPSRPNTTVWIAPKPVFSEFGLGTPTVYGSPACLLEQVKHHHTSSFLVDTEAFQSGPWYGTGSGKFHAMALLISNAANEANKLGKSTFIVSSSTFKRSIEYELLMQSFNYDLAGADRSQMEEGARLSPITEYYLCRSNF
ncbi:hypothetical protein [Corynebacterium epidermidicanis]|uniref:Uncharacterized protein n=1 Tax=Corynebacterium epidermidicanis TaxID=1050174 RepID=A0A0G3GN93_9CORY|nr:hypothetical protein [Corynebacterium epidermidicanis]AKK02035.1 hypothetical protein CEPID_00705 [Corynebacterium epidermidicanis]